ncbi:MAG: helix-turn-helix transcriptional regulator [Saprospirales bacterium]|nr:helix-turn-helix transcriptional regulator [Saprospirales bacterium]
MISIQPIPSIGQQIRQLREERGLPLRKVAAALDIDQSILSKIERGERRATKEQILLIARIFGADEKELLVNYLSDQVLYQIGDEDLVLEALKVAEEKVLYRKNTENGR